MKKSKNAKQLFTGVLAFIFVFCLPATLLATEIINVGDHGLLPNTPNQEIDIFVTNDRATPVFWQGVDFFVQVADGGPVLGAFFGSGQHIIGPSITATLITPPELFSVNNTGVFDGNPGQVGGDQLVTLTTTADANTGSGYPAQAGLSTVLLGIITVDTTGFFSGSWSFAMNNTVVGTSHLLAIGNPISLSDPIDMLITDGTISIAVPEPTSAVLGLFAAGGFTIVAIRNRRARRSA